MVRLRCDKCNSEAAVVGLVGYTEIFLCDNCEGKTRSSSPKPLYPYRQLASVIKADPQNDPLVCGICKVPSILFNPLTYNRQRCRYLLDASFRRAAARFDLKTRHSKDGFRFTVGVVMKQRKNKEMSHRVFSFLVRPGR